MDVYNGMVTNTNLEETLVAGWYRTNEPSPYLMSRGTPPIGDRYTLGDGTIHQISIQNYLANGSQDTVLRVRDLCTTSDPTYCPKAKHQMKIGKIPILPLDETDLSMGIALAYMNRTTAIGQPTATR